MCCEYGAPAGSVVPPRPPYHPVPAGTACAAPPPRDPPAAAVTDAGSNASRILQWWPPRHSSHRQTPSRCQTKRRIDSQRYTPNYGPSQTSPREFRQATAYLARCVSSACERIFFFAAETRCVSPEPTVASPGSAEGQHSYSTPEAHAAAARIRQGVIASPFTVNTALQLSTPHGSHQCSDF